MKKKCYVQVLEQSVGRLLLFWRLGSGIDDADHFMAIDYISGLIVAGYSITARRRNPEHWRAVQAGKVCAGNA